MHQQFSDSLREMYSVWLFSLFSVEVLVGCKLPYSKLSLKFTPDDWVGKVLGGSAHKQRQGCWAGGPCISSLTD